MMSEKERATYIVQVMEYGKKMKLFLEKLDKGEVSTEEQKRALRNIAVFFINFTEKAEEVLR